MKIYTKTGDGGCCSLATGEKVAKDSLRINCYGNIDELNAIIGVCLSIIQTDVEVVKWLQAIQNDLFNIGSDLATISEHPQSYIHYISNKEVEILEQMIDKIELLLPKLNAFVLPRGNLQVTYIHLARTICRRIERLCVTLQREEMINRYIVPYFNRMSDLLFVLSRYMVYKNNEKEIYWLKNNGLLGLEIM